METDTLIIGHNMLCGAERYLFSLLPEKSFLEEVPELYNPIVLLQMKQKELREAYKNIRNIRADKL